MDILLGNSISSEVTMHAYRVFAYYLVNKTFCKPQFYTLPLTTPSKDKHNARVNSGVEASVLVAMVVRAPPSDSLFYYTNLITVYVPLNFDPVPTFRQKTAKHMLLLHFFV